MSVSKCVRGGRVVGVGNETSLQRDKKKNLQTDLIQYQLNSNIPLLKSTHQRQSMILRNTHFAISLNPMRWHPDGSNSSLCTWKPAHRQRVYSRCLLERNTWKQQWRNVTFKSSRALEFTSRSCAMCVSVKSLQSFPRLCCYHEFLDISCQRPYHILSTFYPALSSFYPLWSGHFISLSLFSSGPFIFLSTFYPAPSSFYPLFILPYHLFIHLFIRPYHLLRCVVAAL